MAEINRDEILLNFQACTGVEDIAEALLWLEESEWDLLAAIRNAVPQETQTLPSDYIPSAHPITIPPHPMRQMLNGAPVTICHDFTSNPSTSRYEPSSPSSKLLMFYIHLLDQVSQVQLPETMTVADLKTKVYADTGIPVCTQNLTGWERVPSSDDVRLKSLKLTHTINHLYLATHEGSSSSIGSDFQLDMVPNHSILFTLNIRNELNGKDYMLKLPGARTVGQVKQDAAVLTDIPINNQLWCGWPADVSDSTTLFGAGLSFPVHPLSVGERVRENKTVYMELIDSDSSPEEYEDASETFNEEDEMFVDDLIPRRVDPLIPADIEDEVAGAIHFSEGFARRYGDLHPEFFQGSLEDAIKEACLKPVKERNLLALYLHHDKSVLANVFCTELLCFETVMQTLAEYFVIWGWDITSEGNKNMFLSNVTRYLGGPVADTISTIQVDSLPALIIITRSRSNTELFNVINGNTGVSELMTMLLHAVEVYSEIQKAEMREEEERTKREMIKIEQDQAFQQSLLVDRAKVEAKRKQELHERQERDRIEKEKNELEKQRQAERLRVQAQLPEEPEQGTTEPTIEFRFRCPNGGVLQRRFLTTQKLQVLFNYLVVEGYRTSEFKAILNWPRRDMTLLDLNTTFKDLNLHSQEIVILEER